MKDTITKIVIGIAIGTIISFLLGGSHSLTPEIAAFAYLWGVGSSFAFKHHINKLLKMLNPGLKLSVISFLTFRNGFLGSFPVIAYLVYAISLGWVQGIVIMVTEIIELRNSI